MLDKILDSKNIIHRSLDATAKRHEVIGQNIANIDTPGYKRKDIAFEDALRKAVHSQDFNKRDIPKVKITVVEDQNNTNMRLDGNNVDIDSEMSAMAQNELRHNAMLQLAGYSNITMVLNQSK